MKILIFLPVIILFYFGVGKSKNEPKTFYYYCLSHSMQTNGPAKQFILITGVKTITCDEKDLMAKTKDWRKVVDNQCKNLAGCTGDLNYYYDQTSAETQLVNDKNRFSDTSRYVVSKVDFK